MNYKLNKNHAVIRMKIPIGAVSSIGLVSILS